MYVDTWMLQKRAQLELLLQLQAVQPKAAAHRRNRANSLYSHPTHSQLDLALQIDLAKRSNSISTRSPPRSSYNTGLNVMPLLLRHRTAAAPTTHRHCPALHTSSCCPDHADHSCACLVHLTSGSAPQPPPAAGVLLRQSGLRSQQSEHTQPAPWRIVIVHAQQVFLCG